MSQWPTTLPQTPLRSGYNRTERETVIKSQMGYGPAKLRNRVITSMADLIVRFQLTDAQMFVLDDFYKDNKTRSYSWVWPDTELSYRFLSPPVYRELNCDSWYVTLQIEQMPSPGVQAAYTYTNMSEYTLSADPPAGWQNRAAQSNLIVTAGGVYGGQYLNANYFLEPNISTWEAIPDGSEVDILMSALNIDASRTGVVARFQTSNLEYYMASLDSGLNGQFHIQKGTQEAGLVQLGTTVFGLGINPGDDVLMRFNMTDNVLKAKWWKGGVSQEPPTWHSTTDATYATGKQGLWGSAGTIDEYAVGYDGDTAIFPR